MKVTFSSILLLLISVTLWSFITSMNSTHNIKGKNVVSPSTNPVHESEGEEPWPKELLPTPEIQDKLIKYYKGKHKNFAIAKGRVVAKKKYTAYLTVLHVTVLHLTVLQLRSYRYLYF